MTNSTNVFHFRSRFNFYFFVLSTGILCFSVFFIPFDGPALQVWVLGLLTAIIVIAICSLSVARYFRSYYQIASGGLYRMLFRVSMLVVRWDSIIEVLTYDESDPSLLTFILTDGKRITLNLDDLEQPTAFLDGIRQNISVNCFRQVESSSSFTYQIRGSMGLLLFGLPAIPVGLLTGNIKIVLIGILAGAIFSPIFIISLLHASRQEQQNITSKSRRYIAAVFLPLFLIFILPRVLPIDVSAPLGPQFGSYLLCLGVWITVTYSTLLITNRVLFEIPQQQSTS